MLERLRKNFQGLIKIKSMRFFRKAAIAANNSRIDFAKLAHDETKMGIVEDKVIINHFAAEYIYNKYKNEIKEMYLNAYKK